MTSTEQIAVKKPIRELKRYVGKVVYMYAFDVAYDMSRQPIREMLGEDYNWDEIKLTLAKMKAGNEL